MINPGFDSIDGLNEDFDKIIRDNDENLCVVLFLQLSKLGPILFQPWNALINEKIPKVVFIHVNVEQSIDLAQKYKIIRVPTYLFIKKCKEVDRITTIQIEDVRKLIETHRPPDYYTGKARQISIGANTDFFAQFMTPKTEKQPPQSQESSQPQQSQSQNQNSQIQSQQISNSEQSAQSPIEYEIIEEEETVEIEVQEEEEVPFEDEFSTLYVDDFRQLGYDEDLIQSAIYYTYLNNSAPENRFDECTNYMDSVLGHHMKMVEPQPIPPKTQKITKTVKKLVKRPKNIRRPKPAKPIQNPSPHKIESPHKIGSTQKSHSQKHSTSPSYNLRVSTDEIESFRLKARQTGSIEDQQKLDKAIKQKEFEDLKKKRLENQAYKNSVMKMIKENQQEKEKAKAQAQAQAQNLHESSVQSPSSSLKNNEYRIKLKFPDASYTVETFQKQQTLFDLEKKVRDLKGLDENCEIQFQVDIPYSLFTQEQFNQTLEEADLRNAQLNVTIIQKCQNE